MGITVLRVITKIKQDQLHKTLLEDPGFDSQIHRAAQLAVTPVPGNLAPSSGRHGHHACTQCTDIEAGKIPIHIIKLNYP